MIFTKRQPIKLRPIDERVVWVCVALAAFYAGWSVRDYQYQHRPVPQPAIVFKDRVPLFQFACGDIRGYAEFREACKRRRTT